MIVDRSSSSSQELLLLLQLLLVLGVRVVEDPPEPAVHPGDALLGPEEALAADLVRDAVLDKEKSGEIVKLPTKEYLDYFC